jgi:hypothetical protein
MAARTGFEELMRLVREQWCLGQDMDSLGNSSDVRRFFPETGKVTADQLVYWVFLASGPGTRGPAPMWQRARTAIRADFVRCMGGEIVDASELRWPGGPECQPRYLPIPNPEAFARNLTEDELALYKVEFGEDSREWILARRELERRRVRPTWSWTIGIAALGLLAWLLFFADKQLLQGPALPERPTLCQLAEHRADYAGRVLTVEGFLLVSRHGSTVSDPRCGYGMAVAWRRGTTPGLSRLSAMAEQFETEGPMVVVRVTGEVKQDQFHSLGGEHPWFLDLSDARILRVQPLVEADRDRYLTWLEGPSPEPFQPGR